MNSHKNRDKRDVRIEKLVSNARAIISNQIALPLGIYKMTNLLSSINETGSLEDFDTSVFSNYNSKTINFSIGTERLYCNKEFLKSEDKLLDALTLEFKDEIIDKCFEIIERFGVKK